MWQGIAGRSLHERRHYSVFEANIHVPQNPEMFYEKRRIENKHSRSVKWFQNNCFEKISFFPKNILGHQYIHSVWVVERRGREWERWGVGDQKIEIHE